MTKQILEAKKLENKDFKILNHYHDLEERFEKNYSTCPFLQFLTVVGADQCVYTCQDKAYTEVGKMGSIEGKSFKEFWFSEENKTFLKAFDPSMKCNHHCVSHSKNIAIHEYLSIDQEHGYFV